MKTLSLALALITALGMLSPVLAAPQHEHAAHAAHAGDQVPVPAQRWATDAPLRDGMGRIHQALEELRHYEMGHMSETMALDRVGLIDEATRFIFTNCKLTPQADEVMHGMLVPLMAASKALKAHPQDMAEVAAMRSAVAAYPVYFDDPGWPAAAPDKAASPAEHEHAAH